MSDPSDRPRRTDTARFNARCPTCGGSHVVRLERDPLRSHNVNQTVMCRECWEGMRDATGPHLEGCSLKRSSLHPCGCNPAAASVYVRGE